MIEIERKFLVKSQDFKDLATSNYEMQQGFLNTDKQRTVRVRIMEDKTFLTVKGISSADGLERFEWEKEFPLSDGEQLIHLCHKPIIQKTRYLVPYENHIFEVDEFYGVNQGLVIAEVELQHKDETLKLPYWIGAEVTGDPKYYNSSLVRLPYRDWAKRL